MRRQRLVYPKSKQPKVNQPPDSKGVIGRDNQDIFKQSIGNFPDTESIERKNVRYYVDNESTKDCSQRNKLSPKIPVIAFCGLLHRMFTHIFCTFSLHPKKSDAYKPRVILSFVKEEPERYCNLIASP
ncbi:hypothetical protein GXM_08146 [Nostoc sphaeroides CCNUC1]|uniref:Uncharacterized protein n=1 Tax=Nostoc sphaeroides CCNUC1 TaxID=2653204 RepID=A0A5P8WDN1_9NOSO|nr:hypothetical protein GXM_08146 [Nostoc sphaeroides CCNUC1]